MVPIFFLSKKLGLTVFSILSNLIGRSGAKLQKEIIPKTTFFLPIVSSYEDESIRRICFPYEHCKKSSYKKVIYGRRWMLGRRFEFKIYCLKRWFLTIGTQ
jgi:hypothetical protein